MSKLVVDEIQYSGGTALTLPTTSPTAGDRLKTDGSGNLGWANYTTSIQRPSQLYNMPAASGNANQALKTDGSGNIGFANAPGNPMYVEGAGTNQRYGYYLVDKVDTIAGSPGNNFSVRVPTSFVPAGQEAKLIGMYMRVVNLGGAANSSKIYIRGMTNGGGSAHSGNAVNTMEIYRYGGSGSGYNNSNSTDGSYIYGGTLPNQNPWGDGTVQFTDTGSTTQYGKGQYVELFMYMAESMAEAWGTGGFANSSNTAFGYVHFWNYKQPQYNGYRVFSNAPYGFLFSNSQGSNFNDGFVELYALMRDDATYP